MREKVESQVGCGVFYLLFIQHCHRACINARPRVCCQEVSACMTELLKSSSGRVSMSMFVNECLLLTVERTSTARHHTGKMLHHLIRTHVLTLSDYIAGLHEFLGLADDMVIDVPRIWQYIAELISPLLLDEHSEIPLDFLRKACAPLLACEGGDKAALVISMVLLDAVHSLVCHSPSVYLS